MPHSHDRPYVFYKSKDGEIPGRAAGVLFWANVIEFRDDGKEADLDLPMHDEHNQHGWKPIKLFGVRRGHHYGEFEDPGTAYEDWNETDKAQERLAARAEGDPK